MFEPLTRYYNRLGFLLVTATLMLGNACSSSKDDLLEEVAEPRCLMEMYVDLGEGGGVLSRANPPSGDGFDEGLETENTIDPEDIGIYLFTMDNRLIASLGHTDYNETEFKLTRLDRSVYRMQFRVDRLLPGAYADPQSFKVVMLANWGRSYPVLSLPADDGAPVPTIADLTTAVEAIGSYSLAGADDGKQVFPALAEGNRIPMFGVQEYQNIRFRPGSVEIRFERLLLLRAYAKIEVYDDEEVSQKLQRVTLTRYNTKFYKAPLNVFGSDGYTGWGGGEDYVVTLSLPEGKPHEWESAGEIELQKDASGHFVTYVPEYKNTGRTGDGGRATLTLHYGVDYNGAHISDHEIYFERYRDGVTTGESYDIRRNYWYKFVVRHNGPTDIELTTDVIPYKSVILEPDFGFGD